MKKEFLSDKKSLDVFMKQFSIKSAHARGHTSIPTEKELMLFNAFFVTYI